MFTSMSDFSNYLLMVVNMSICMLGGMPAFCEFGSFLTHLALCATRADFMNVDSDGLSYSNQ